MTASDGAGAASDTFTLHIAPVNDAPVVAIPIEDRHSDEDQPWSFTIPADTFSDPDGPVSISSIVVSGASNIDAVSVNLLTRTISYTPVADFNGSFDVTVTANDGTASVSDTFTYFIDAINDAPVVTVPGTQTAIRDVNLVFDTAHGNKISVSDVDAQFAVMVISATNGTFSVLHPFFGFTTNFYGPMPFLISNTEMIVFRPNPGFTGQATLTITLNDKGSSGQGGELSDSETIIINVVDNVAPELDFTKTPVLANELEDAGAPSGPVGTLVSSLVDRDTPTGQVDNVKDVGPELGIAITAANTANGSWFYSIDGGANWNALGPVSESNARLLAADASTRIYFQPAPNWNGSIGDAITFRAWDQLTGTNGGLADTSGTNNGGATAFSTDTDTASLTIENAIDVPVAVDDYYTVTEDGALIVAAPGPIENDISLDNPITGTYTSSPPTVQHAFSLLYTHLGSFEYTPTPDYFGPDSFTYYVTDGSNDSNLATVYITVEARPDTPSISSATTDEDVQSSAGLIISRAAVDSSEVTHFRISNITGGTLFKNDGVTAIANGDFITFAEGNAGLKFTPTANSSTSGSFDVQATLDAAGTHLSPVATASITVNPVADTPGVTDATTEEDVRTTSGLVITANAADGAEVTHFKIANITHGTLYLADGTTEIDDGSFITVAQGNAGLKFSPAPDFNGTATFDVTASLSADDTGLGDTAATATITVDPVNDAPLNHVPGSQTTPEDTALVFAGANGVAIRDDAGIGGMQVEIVPTNGSVTLGSTDPIVFIIGASPGTLLFQGTLAQINEALDGMTFVPSANYTGPASIRISTEDSGNTGIGGPLNDVDTILIDVVPVNDAPVVPALRDLTIAEDTPSGAIPIGASDIDGDPLGYSVLASHQPLLGNVTFSAGTYRHAARECKRAGQFHHRRIRRTWRGGHAIGRRDDHACAGRAGRGCRQRRRAAERAAVADHGPAHRQRFRSGR